MSVHIRIYIYAYTYMRLFIYIHVSIRTHICRCVYILKWLALHGANIYVLVYSHRYIYTYAYTCKFIYIRMNVQNKSIYTHTCRTQSYIYMCTYIWLVRHPGDSVTIGKQSLIWRIQIFICIQIYTHICRNKSISTYIHMNGVIVRTMLRSKSSIRYGGHIQLQPIAFRVSFPQSHDLNRWSRFLDLFSQVSMTLLLSFHEMSNTLLHTTAHHSTLQRTVTHCNALQHTQTTQTNSYETRLTKSRLEIESEWMTLRMQ